MEDDLNFDFSFDVAGKIWQLSIDESSAQIGIEIRDESEQSLSFLVFDLESLEVSDYFEIDAADWWSTLIRLQAGYLFLDKYLDPQDPTKKNLLVYDTKKTELLAEIEDFQLIEIIENELLGTLASDRSVASKISKKELDITTRSTATLSDYIHPVFCPAGSETFVLAATYLEQEIALAVEYFENDRNIIIGYYVRSGTKFDRKLVLIEDGVEKAHIVQDQNLNGYASGSYLLLNNYLIFISKSNQINGIKL